MPTDAERLTAIWELASSTLTMQMPSDVREVMAAIIQLAVVRSDEQKQHAED